MNWVLLAGVLLVAGCSDTADVFPLNDQARSIGHPSVSFVRTGVGREPITITMPDGEVLTGEWRVAFGGGMAMGFSGSHSATAVAIGDGALQFVARGPKTEVLCRGTSSAFGHGNGECQTYDGAIWAISW